MYRLFSVCVFLDLSAIQGSKSVLHNFNLCTEVIYILLIQCITTCFPPDLPVVTVYNMLEDYGESPKDRYPGGQPAQNQTKPQLFPRTLLPLPKHTLVKYIVSLIIWSDCISKIQAWWHLVVSVISSCYEVTRWIVKAFADLAFLKLAWAREMIQMLIWFIHCRK